MKSEEGPGIVSQMGSLSKRGVKAETGKSVLARAHAKALWQKEHQEPQGRSRPVRLQCRE